jgi:hypothetical protein
MFQYDNHCCLVMNCMSATLMDFLCQPRPPSPTPTPLPMTNQHQHNNPLLEDQGKIDLVNTVPVLHPR